VNTAPGPQPTQLIEHEQHCSDRSSANEAVWIIVYVPAQR
jgi:hypothetical protein